MSFKKATNYENVFRKVTINVSKELKVNDTYVVLREPKTEEAMGLRRADSEDEAVKAIHKLLPHIIVDHNFYEDAEETKRMTNEDIAEVLYECFPAFQKVLEEYTAAVFPKSE